MTCSVHNDESIIHGVKAVGRVIGVFIPIMEFVVSSLGMMYGTVRSPLEILRPCFLYYRRPLADVNRCAWESLKGFLQDAVPDDDPGAVAAMQTFSGFTCLFPIETRSLRETIIQVIRFMDTAWLHIFSFYFLNFSQMEINALNFCRYFESRRLPLIS